MKPNSPDGYGADFRKFLFQGRQFGLCGASLCFGAAHPLAPSIPAAGKTSKNRND